MYRRIHFLVGIILSAIVMVVNCGCARRQVVQHFAKPVLEQQVSYSRLALIEFESREPIVHSEIKEPIFGWPISDTPPSHVRNLTFDDCFTLAGQSAPVARQIVQHRQWLQCQTSAAPALLSAMNYQAAHERNTHTAAALEAYLNLAEIYAQQPLVAETEDLFKDATASLTKLLEAGIPMPVDFGQTDRLRLALQQKTANLRYEQTRLHSGLSLLLNLDPAEATPIWTSLQISDPEPEKSLDESLATAFAQRGDLKVLETLARDDCGISPESFEGQAAAASPLLGSSIPLPGPAKWWQCALKEKIDCLKEKERAQRKSQLSQLAMEKRRTIEVEIRDAFSSRERHWEIVKLKRAELESLTQSIEAAVKAKDERPVDFVTYQENRQKLVQLTSEIVHELFAIEVDRVRIRKSEGDLSH